MPNTLKSEDFGLKIYNRFPFKYREDDEKQNFALKRYIQSLADGGFKYCIDEINGIINLIDPDNTDTKVLPILFRQYGLEIFNGIPENYLRYLLPKLGELYSKKGSIDVVEFITSSLTGIKTSTEVTYIERDKDGNIIRNDPDNPYIDIKLEMDYNNGNYFPDSEQLERLLSNFVPFYCDLRLVYSYMFYEEEVLTLKELSEILNIKDSVIESGSLNVTDIDIVQKEVIKDKISEESQKIWNSDSNCLTNNLSKLLSSNEESSRFFTNGLVSYDNITNKDGSKEVRY